MTSQYLGKQGWGSFLSMRAFLCIFLVTSLAISLGSESAQAGEVDESALFGSTEGTPPITVPSSVPVAPEPVGRDAQELQTSHPDRDAFASGEVSENPLQIGGTFYQRMIVSPQSG